ncbi:hypothetical protein GCM10022220_55550 [Actinocatenispora rupis]|uniref:Uncharacterized protein n=1 Tax=Actinocatenispora rupis TaxID=519421 RepID=A0A8J3NCR6_9ACTN|nr:hypothetical protein Aru02nite_54880 [Actinocatenispora rupis]
MPFGSPRFTLPIGLVAGGAGLVAWPEPVPGLRPALLVFWLGAAVGETTVRYATSRPNVDPSPSGSRELTARRSDGLLRGYARALPPVRLRSHVPRADDTTCLLVLVAPRSSGDVTAVPRREVHVIGLDLLVRTGIWPDEDGRAEAVILVEDASRVRITCLAGESISMFVSALLAAGMDLVLDLFHPDLPELPGWTVTITDTALAIRWPTEGHLVDAPVQVSDRWRRTVATNGHVTLLGGTGLGLTDGEDLPRPVAAYHNGTLAGGVASVSEQP